MSQTLYVGNVSYQSTDDSLAAAFAAAGTVVSAKIVMDKFTGRSRGFAFVDMDSPEAANKAIELLDGKDLDGRQLRVSLARPKEDRPPRRDFRN
jgi:RNA recognition motif-containing protein